MEAELSGRNQRLSGSCVITISDLNYDCLDRIYLASAQHEVRVKRPSGPEPTYGRVKALDTSGSSVGRNQPAKNEEVAATERTPEWEKEPADGCLHRVPVTHAPEIDRSAMRTPRD